MVLVWPEWRGKVWFCGPGSETHVAVVTTHRGEQYLRLKVVTLHPPWRCLRKPIWPIHRCTSVPCECMSGGCFPSSGLRGCLLLTILFPNGTFIFYCFINTQMSTWTSQPSNVPVVPDINNNKWWFTLLSLAKLNQAVVSWPGYLSWSLEPCWRGPFENISEPAELDFLSAR